MPVEVRELIIKTTIGQEPQTGALQATPAANNEMTPAQEIIQTCVEKILEIIKEKLER
ncbi:MAG TPA: DUF5908 family protein [Saprospiraceae bacterium]|nr:DUF5908 family protein [Saprospiraceae bacterium]